MLLATTAGTASAQSYDPLANTHADPDRLDRELAVLRNAANICWARGEPVTVDWLAEHDAGYRRGAFSRYHLSEGDNAWRWVRRDSSFGPDVRAASTVEGVPYTELTVRARGTLSPGANFAIQSELANGAVRFDWTAPPEKLCMAEGLNLTADVEVLEGSPGAQSIVIILPLTPEQIQAEGDDVKACSPSASTGTDSEIDYFSDSGRCRRELFHLDPRATWDVWVSLPESFYVVYRYEPAETK